MKFNETAKFSIWKTTKKRANLQVSYISTVRKLYLNASILLGFLRFLMAARRIMDVLSGKIVGPKSAAQPSCFREGRTDLRFFRLPFAVLQLRENLKKARSSYSVHRVGGSRGAPKIKVQVLVAVCRTPSLKPPRAQARGPSDDPVSLEPRRAADFFGFLWLFGYETRARGRTCVKPRQSSPGSKGNDRKHARAPFLAVRASWKLKVDGF